MRFNNKASVVEYIHVKLKKINPEQACDYPVEWPSRVGVYGGRYAG